MNKFTGFIQERQNLLQGKIEELKKMLVENNPDVIARNSHIHFKSRDVEFQNFQLRYWQETTTISYPGFVAAGGDGKELSSIHQALLLYYLITSDGTIITNKWISFSELPGGIFYQRAFQGYTGHELEKRFSSDIGLFSERAVRIGGIPCDFGGFSFEIKILPCVSLLIVGWQGDDELPTSFQLLFNSSAAHYLPTDAYAILGSLLTQKLCSS